MTIRQVAARLEVHPATVYRLIHDGTLRALKIRGTFRVTAADVEDLEARVLYRPQTGALSTNRASAGRPLIDQARPTRPALRGNA